MIRTFYQGGSQQHVSLITNVQFSNNLHSTSKYKEYINCCLYFDTFLFLFHFGTCTLQENLLSSTLYLGTVFSNSIIFYRIVYGADVTLFQYPWC